MNVMCLLELTLRATESISFPRVSAPVLHGAIHRLLQGVDEAYGRQIHDQQLKPMALSPLVHGPGREIGGTSVPAGARLGARIGVLESELLAVLMAELLRRRQSRQPLSLDGRDAAVDEVRIIGGPTTYRRFAEQATPAHDIVLRFVTPTVFRRKGESKLAERGPAPRLPFGGYMRRWRAFAPPDLVTAVTDETIDAYLSLTDGKCAEDLVDLGMTRQPAFLGWASYRIGGDDHFRREIATLAAYSAYCGTGARTAYGLGQTIVHDLSSPATNACDARKEKSA